MDNNIDPTMVLKYVREQKRHINDTFSNTNNNTAMLLPNNTNMINGNNSSNMGTIVNGTSNKISNNGSIMAQNIAHDIHNHHKYNQQQQQQQHHHNHLHQQQQQQQQHQSVIFQAPTTLPPQNIQYAQKSLPPPSSVLSQQSQRVNMSDMYSNNHHQKIYYSTNNQQLSDLPSPKSALMLSSHNNNNNAPNGNIIKNKTPPYMEYTISRSGSAKSVASDSGVGSSSPLSDCGSDYGPNNSNNINNNQNNCDIIITHAGVPANKLSTQPAPMRTTLSSSTNNNNNNNINNSTNSTSTSPLSSSSSSSTSPQSNSSSLHRKRKSSANIYDEIIMNNTTNKLINKQIQQQQQHYNDLVIDANNNNKQIHIGHNSHHQHHQSIQNPSFYNNGNNNKYNNHPSQHVQNQPQHQHPQQHHQIIKCDKECCVGPMNASHKRLSICDCKECMIIDNSKKPTTQNQPKLMQLAYNGNSNGNNNNHHHHQPNHSQIGVISLNHNNVQQLPVQVALQQANTPNTINQYPSHHHNNSHHNPHQQITPQPASSSSLKSYCDCPSCNISSSSNNHSNNSAFVSTSASSNSYYNNNPNNRLSSSQTAHQLQLQLQQHHIPVGDLQLVKEQLSKEILNQCREYSTVSSLGNGHSNLRLQAASNQYYSGGNGNQQHQPGIVVPIPVPAPIPAPIQAPMQISIQSSVPQQQQQYCSCPDCYLPKQKLAQQMGSSPAHNPHQQFKPNMIVQNHHQRSYSASSSVMPPKTTHLPTQPSGLSITPSPVIEKSISLASSSNKMNKIKNVSKIGSPMLVSTNAIPASQLSATISNSSLTFANEYNDLLSNGLHITKQKNNFYNHYNNTSNNQKPKDHQQTSLVCLSVNNQINGTNNPSNISVRNSAEYNAHIEEEDDDIELGEVVRIDKIINKCQPAPINRTVSSPMIPRPESNTPINHVQSSSPSASSNSITITPSPSPSHDIVQPPNTNSPNQQQQQQQQVPTNQYQPVVSIPKKMLPIITRRIQDWLEKSVELLNKISIKTDLNFASLFELLTKAWSRILIVYMIENSFDFCVTKSDQSLNDNNNNNSFKMTNSLIPKEKDAAKLLEIINKGHNLNLNTQEYDELREIILFKEGADDANYNKAYANAQKQLQELIRQRNPNSNEQFISNLFLFLPKIYEIKAELIENLFCRNLNNFKSVYELLDKKFNDINESRSQQQQQQQQLRESPHQNQNS